MTLLPQCQLCPTSQSLLRCAGCKVVRYCSKNHQVSNWSQHKSACNGIKSCSARLKSEERELRNQPPGDIFAPPNVFEECVGHFWGLHHTRPYMRARFALVEALLKVKSYDAASAALDHLMDCLRLCRSDNMGVRQLIPALLVRLGREQECYDFVKWWEIVRNDNDYDYGDMDAPYLDLKDADLLESPEYLCGQFPDLCHIVPITLLKIKLLLAARAGSDGCEHLRSSQTFNQIEDRARQMAPAGNLDFDEPVEVIEVLKSQVNMLYQAVDKANSHFWDAFFDPGPHLKKRPDSWSRGSEEEMQLALKWCYDAWKECPRAIEVVKAIFDSDSEVL